MKKHKSCKERNVKINFASYKTFKKERKFPNLVQQSTSWRCFEGKLATKTTMHCPSFLLRKEMKKKTYSLKSRKIWCSTNLKTWKREKDLEKLTFQQSKSWCFQATVIEVFKYLLLREKMKKKTLPTQSQETLKHWKERKRT
jgi:hypothetical protein